MFKKPNCPVIALEEHYWDDELEKTYTGGEAGRPGEQYTRLKDLGALRLKEMDEAAIDIQVLSHGVPSTQKLPAETAAAVTRRSDAVACRSSDTMPLRSAMCSAPHSNSWKAAGTTITRPAVTHNGSNLVGSSVKRNDMQRMSATGHKQTF